MPITTEDIKLLASQRLTDNDDGGGRVTATEIVDGNVNNLFPDISRMDRVYGRVSLRKAFVNVQTPDVQVYSGAHVILSAPAVDPNISTCMFTTGDPNDERTSARDRLESYVTVGPRFQGWLWGDQPAGSKTLLVFTVKGIQIPDIGSVLALYNDKGLATEELQYVRVTKTEMKNSEFTVESGSTSTSFNRDILSIEIGDPLRYTFTGVEMHSNDALPTNLYTTTVSDAAKYYGVMLPTEAYDAGDISLKVNSIYAHLVPSAQGESPVVDVSVGEAGPVVESGEPFTVTGTIFHPGGSNVTQFFFGRGIKPTTLQAITGTGKTFTDDGAGILLDGTTEIGTVDYSTGTMSITNYSNSIPNTTLSMTATVGVEVPRIPNTASMVVSSSNQGYNYVEILDPLPVPGSLLVDFMAQGKWYRLVDDGLGHLVPTITGTGSGTINYATGSVIVTCGALPDVGSAIMYNWANPIETEDLSGKVTIELPSVVHQLPTYPVEPGTVQITWPYGVDQTATATDNGNGGFSGDANGWINYSTGEMEFKPTLVPIQDADYTIDYEKYARIDGAASPSGSGVISFNLPSGPVRPGSVHISCGVSLNGHPVVYKLYDNGAGGLAAAGFSFDFPVSHPSWPGSTTVSGITGTIDYINRTVSIDLSSVSGSETWKEPVTEQLLMKTGTVNTWRSWPVYGKVWVTKYKEPVTSGIEWAGNTAGIVNYSYALTAAAQETANEVVAVPPFVIDLTKNNAGYTIVPGSIDFSWAGNRYVDRLGKLYRNPSATTGYGVEAGTINYDTGVIELTLYDGGSNTITLHSITGRIGNQLLPSVTFRTPGAPIRPGSLSIQGTTVDGETISGNSDFDGIITGENVVGTVDYETGIVLLQFAKEVPDDPEYHDEDWYDPANVVGGMLLKPVQAVGDSLTYACVAYTYIPLDADLIGLDPVRLPSDGRVPVVKAGDVIVVHNTVNTAMPTDINAGDVYDLPRTGVVSVELYDSAEPPVRVESTKYAFDKDAQTVTMDAMSFDPLVYTIPIVCSHRVEDMALVSGVEINGSLTIAAGLTNDYPVDGTYVSTALLFGDLQARAFNLFDQTTWTGEWSDNIIGDATTANFNEINYPIVVTNEGSVRERWALVFDSTDHFQVIGEAYGVVDDGYITVDCQPINPSTNMPFFSINHNGWGSGWAAGNVVRFNTEGAMADLWVARTTLQGPATEPNDQFTMQIRGDAE